MPLTYYDALRNLFNHMVEFIETSLDKTYAAIADPTRRAILTALLDKPLRVTEVAKPFDMSLNAVSKHIRLLEQAGLVQREIRGRDHWLTFNDTPLRDASDWIENARKFWMNSLDGLEAFLTTKRQRKRRRI